MWLQLKKTFAFMQIMITILCLGVFFYTRGNWGATAAVFGIMQVGNVAGAWWGIRLRARIEHRLSALPLRAR